MTLDLSTPVDREPQAVRRFRLEVAQEQLDDLHDRVARTRWPGEVAGAGWRYGAPPGLYPLRAQGGDWGHAITLELAALDAEHVVGIHLNTLLTLPPTDPQEAAALTADDQARLRRPVEAEAEMSGYDKVQSTRPQTLAYGLTDSPVGQLAWIAEKFHEWTGRDSAVSRDRLLTNVMLSWLTATAGSSARLYYEAFHGSAPPQRARSAVPMGWRCSPMIWPARCAASPNGTTASCTGASSPRAATSPPLSNPPCSPTTSAHSSAGAGPV